MGLYQELMKNRDTSGADSYLSKMFRRTGVPDTPELQRIVGLPRRVWTTEEVEGFDALALAAGMTAIYRTEDGTMELWPRQAKVLQELHDYGGAMAIFAVGDGKAQPNSEIVLLEQGWTPIGDVRIGDRIYGSDGELHVVLGVFPQGVRPISELTFSDGSTVRCDEEHLWTFKDSGSHNNKVSTRPLREWLEKPLFRRGKPNKNTPDGSRINRLFAPVLSSPIQRPEKQFSLDPYTLGALLGDGSMSQDTVGFTSMDEDIVGALELPSPVEALPRTYQNSGRATDYKLTGARFMPERKRPVMGSNGWRNPLIALLADMGLMGHTSHTKFIPPEYMQGSAEQRLALLQGLLDTDGSIERSQAGYSSVSKTLIAQVRELARSLGGVVKTDERENHTRLLISFPAGLKPFRCERKAVPYAKVEERRQRQPYRALIKVEHVGEEEATCISVSAPDKLYVTRNHILTHNTAVSALASKVCEIPGSQTLLVVPGKLLKRKTPRELRELQEHFEFQLPRVVSYEKISRKGGTELLREWAPKLIVFDEVHRVRNKDAAVTRRFKEYIEEHRPRVLAMSGTIMSRKLKDFAHILLWCVDMPRTPLPQKFKDFEKWSAAFDVIKPHEKTIRATAGALTQLFGPEEEEVAQKEALKATRMAIRRRMVETPGIVASEKERSIAASLNIRVEVVEGYNPRIHRLFAELNDGTLPNGDPVTESNLPARWRTARELTSGFWYAWEPPPPEEWLQPRRAWKGLARSILSRHISGVESEFVLAGLVEKGVDRLRKVGIGKDTARELVEARAAWKEVKGTFKPNSVPVWEDTRMLDYVASWVQKNRGIVWVSEKALGLALEKQGIAPYFGAQGMSLDGRFIEDVTAKAERCIVASVASNGEGRNLQYQWSNNLIISPPPTGLVNEQMLGRTHRNGQEADEVEATYLVGCRTEWECWLQACDDAEAQSAGENPKKLSIASKDIDKIPLHSNALW